MPDGVSDSGGNHGSETSPTSTALGELSLKIKHLLRKEISIEIHHIPRAPVLDDNRPHPGSPLPPVAAMHV